MRQHFLAPAEQTGQQDSKDFQRAAVHIFLQAVSQFDLSLKMSEGLSANRRLPMRRDYVCVHQRLPGREIQVACKQAEA